MPDTKLFYLINHGCSGPFLDILMTLVSELGGGECIAVLALLPLFLAQKGKKRLALVLWAGLTATYYVSYLLKGIVARPRPFVVFPDAYVLAQEKSFSFPSTHAMQSFMAATVAAAFLKGRGVYFAFATLVAFSRVYLGVHYVSDVICGALLGILIGCILVRIAKIE